MPSRRRQRSTSKAPLPDPIKIPAKYSYQNMMKKHEMKHASIQFRNNLVNSHRRAAYQNEFDRVNNILNSHILNQDHPHYHHLLERKDRLKQLANESLGPIPHEIYKR